MWECVFKPQSGSKRKKCGVAIVTWTAAVAVAGAGAGFSGCVAEGEGGDGAGDVAVRGDAADAPPAATMSAHATRDILWREHKIYYGGKIRYIMAGSAEIGRPPPDIAARTSPLSKRP